jgi:hypothetical protein
MWAALGLAEAVRFKLIEDWPTANGRGCVETYFFAQRKNDLPESVCC